MDRVRRHDFERSHIGDGAVVGAGAVVAKDVKPYAIVAGNPANLLKYRFNEYVIRRLLREKWWDLPWNQLREKIPWLMSSSV